MYDAPLWCIFFYYSQCFLQEHLHMYENKIPKTSTNNNAAAIIKGIRIPVKNAVKAEPNIAPSTKVNSAVSIYKIGLTQQQCVL